MQPLIAVTRTVAVPPSAGTSICLRSMSKWQGAPSCAMSSRTGPTDMLAPRPTGVPFGATRYATVAGPCPCVWPGTVIHAASVVTVQVQSRSLWMAIVPSPPPAGTDCSDALADSPHRSDDDDGLVTDEVPEVQAPTNTLARTTRPSRTPAQYAKQSPAIATSR